MKTIYTYDQVLNADFCRRFPATRQITIKEILEIKKQEDNQEKNLIKQLKKIYN